jgi:hypothetical protein
VGGVANENITDGRHRCPLRARRNAACAALERFGCRPQADKGESFDFASKAVVTPLMRHHAQYDADRLCECQASKRALTLVSDLKQQARPRQHPAPLMPRAALAMLVARASSEPEQRSAGDRAPHKETPSTRTKRSNNERSRRTGTK